MQSFAQETIKIRKNRRKEIFKTSPSNYFCTFLAPVYLSAPASLTGILDGILHGLELFSPVVIIHRLLSASTSLVRDEVPQAPLPGCSDGCSPPHPQHRRFGPSPGTKLWPWTTPRLQTSCVCNSGQTWAVPSEVEGRISSCGITQPTSQRLCLTKLPFEQAFSFT